MDTIAWNEFEKVELRVGMVLEVEDFPQAKKPAYQLKVDFGAEIGIKSSSAQLTGLYSKEDLLGRQGPGCCEFSNQTDRAVCF